MKKYIFVIALCLSNNAWAMKIEKYSSKPVKSKKITPDFHKDGWEIVRDINRYTGILPGKPLPNKTKISTQNSKARL
jgi:hypothetical protein